MVYAKWDDVLFCDNLEQHFVTYQWYHNGEAIVGLLISIIIILKGFPDPIMW